MNEQGTTKKAVLILASATLLIAVAGIGLGSSQARKPVAISAQGKQCLQCHQNTTPGVVDQWKNSAHYRTGIDCYSCHKANEGDPATFDHYGQKIAVIVTPNYCNRCHKKQVAEFEASHHAKAAGFIGSLDNILGEVVEGGAAAVNGCMQCHGLDREVQRRRKIRREHVAQQRHRPGQSRRLEGNLRGVSRPALVFFSSRAPA